MNGSIEQLDEMCSHLIEIKKQEGLRKLRWEGQFICRSENQMPERHFAKMAEAGCRTLYLGIESASERVRHHMKKKFTNVDLDYTLRMCHKYGIRMVWLMMVGYVTETERIGKRNAIWWQA